MSEHPTLFESATGARLGFQTAEEFNRLMDLSLSWREVVDDERYRVTDMDVGGFTFSVTALHNGKSTRGHEHSWPEVYVGLKGRGTLFLNSLSFENVMDPPITILKEFDLLPGDHFVIPGGVHHRVHAHTEMEFACYFTRER